MLALRRSRAARLIAAALVAPWAVWALVRGLDLDTFHPAIAIVSFTPYMAATAVVPVLVALLLRRWLSLVVAIVAAAVLGLAVLPRTQAGQAADPADGVASVTVMALNVYVGAASPEEVVRLVREEDVDVLTLEELRGDALARFDAAGLRTLLPARVVQPRDGGSAVLAKAGMLAGGDASAPDALVRVPGAAPVRVTAVHPHPPLNRRHTAAWRRALEALPSAREGDALRILAGDFNATLDHRDLRHLLDRGYVDAADALGKGLRPTWPSDRRFFGITIDHVLVDPRIAVQRYALHQVEGTDHRAVVADVRLPRP